jgi:predicted HTH domain antitoxin
MNQLTINIPAIENLDETEVRRFLAAKLYESGRLSLGRAAELAGLSKLAFSEILADYDVSLINYTSSDILEDAARI